MRHDSDFVYIPERNALNILSKIISVCKEELDGKYNEVQILTPTKKGMLGTKELNKVLQNELNPEDNEKNEKAYGQIIFREGDKVMQVKNNYDLVWEKLGGMENGTGVFNGDLGVIQKIDDVDKRIKVRFDDEKIVWYEYSRVRRVRTFICNNNT